ncbi:hypothetical protein [Nocardioides marmoribigeumensis]|jgi:hypothetical protein|uniref:Uncharacterized protein n=1 Tax=Nocardioides marmoribigeumensis TaxID=433649 RepID=A0ABU2BZQ0_9ACTN|nr:hypothetical protein [Nocardioides marmoribigeumensis]MDR7363849.1 hypothetical protein [Nocardioides marmoribigeumensis]
MRITTTTRRTATVVATAGAALALAAGAASAHDCFVPMQSLNAPVSANWEAINAEQIAGFGFGYEAPCAGASKAGYAALKAAGLPVGVKIYVGSNAAGEMTIGGHSANPNLADGKGLDNFEAGSELPFQIAGVWYDAASHHVC